MKNISQIPLLLTSIFYVNSYCADIDDVQRLYPVKFNESLHGSYSKKTLKRFSLFNSYFSLSQPVTLIDCHDFLSGHGPETPVICKGLLDAYEKKQVSCPELKEQFINPQLHTLVEIFRTADFLNSPSVIVTNIARMILDKIPTTPEFLTDPKNFLKNNSALADKYIKCHLKSIIALLPQVYAPLQDGFGAQVSFCKQANDSHKCVFYSNATTPNAQKFNVISQSGNTQINCVISIREPSFLDYSLQLTNRVIKKSYRATYTVFEARPSLDHQVLVSDCMAAIIDKKNGHLCVIPHGQKTDLMFNPYTIPPNQDACIAGDNLLCTTHAPTEKEQSTYLRFIKFDLTESLAVPQQNVGSLKGNRVQVSQIISSATGKYLFWQQTDNGNKQNKLTLYDLINYRRKTVTISQGCRIATSQTDDDVFAMTLPNNHIELYRINSGSLKKNFMTLLGSNAPAGKQEIAIYKHLVANNYGDMWRFDHKNLKLASQIALYASQHPQTPVELKKVLHEYAAESMRAHNQDRSAVTTNPSAE